MEIKKFVDDIMQENTYLINYENDFYLIDPGFSYPSVIKFLNLANIKLKGILITHGHYDHFAGVDEILKHQKCPVYINQKDAPLFKGEKRLSFESYVIKAPTKDIIFDLDLKGLTVYETPGHSKGSVCLLFTKEKILFSGDVLFYDGYGRTDLYGGDFNEMQKSLNLILDLDKNIVVYAGHGRKTTISNEQKFKNII